MLKDAAAVGYLRRDAFKSMETLHCYQFSQGKTTSKNLHPVKEIFLFWDIPSVIRLGLTMPDCTFLGLVKDFPHQPFQCIGYPLPESPLC